MDVTPSRPTIKKAESDATDFVYLGICRNRLGMFFDMAAEVLWVLFNDTYEMERWS
jgi:hypothetical protein